MAVKRRAKTSRNLGPRGPRGHAGHTGRAGPPGPSLNSEELKQLAAQVEELVKELQTQLTRIAQIQEQLDRFTLGESLNALERRSTSRIDH